MGNWRKFVEYLENFVKIHRNLYKFEKNHHKVNLSQEFIAQIHLTMSFFVQSSHVADALTRSSWTRRN